LGSLTAGAPERQTGLSRFHPDPTAVARNLPADCRWTRRRPWRLRPDRSGV